MGQGRAQALPFSCAGFAACRARARRPMSRGPSHRWYSLRAAFRADLQRSRRRDRDHCGARARPRRARVGADAGAGHRAAAAASRSFRRATTRPCSRKARCPAGSARKSGPSSPTRSSTATGRISALNSVWLLAFGTPVARRFGAMRFLAFFAVTAAAGALRILRLMPECVRADGRRFGVDLGLHGGGDALRVSALRSARIDRATIGEAYRVPALPLLAVLRDPRVLAFLGVWFGAQSSVRYRLARHSTAASRRSPGRRISAGFSPACWHSRCSIRSRPARFGGSGAGPDRRRFTNRQARQFDLHDGLAAAMILRPDSHQRRQAADVERSSGAHVRGDERLA